jgi:uncharacterized membrane protein
LSPRVFSRGLLGAVATTGAVAAGVALFETALLPGLVIGAAAVLAPQLIPRRNGRAKTAGNGAPNGAAQAKPSRFDLSDILPQSLSELTHIKFSRSVVKTITFRVIVTGLDFTANYLILQEPTTAAGLSAISLVGGPLFYFIHESTWNYLVGTGKLDFGSRATGWSILNNHPLVKTITYRTFATIVEFTTNYVVVGDLATAALLSSFGFFLGPFVYYGHEIAWERFGSRGSDAGDPRRTRPTRRGPVVIDVEPEAMPSPA